MAKAQRHQVLVDLDEELARTAKVTGRNLEWSAADKAVLALIGANRDRAAMLKDHCDRSTDVKQVRLIAAEMRATDAALARLVKLVKTEPPAAPKQESLTTVKNRRAAMVRWDRELGRNA